MKTSRMTEPSDAYRKGLIGEEKALEYLLDLGMKLLETRYHSPYGEIDLVMADADGIAFVEVKSRTKGTKGTGLVAITRTKQRRLIRTALYYIAEHGYAGVMRFDALEITSAGIHYIKNAFEAWEE